MKKLITIIVPIYNCQNCINRGIDSLINQTYRDIEIILIDDGSTDQSGKICDEYSKKDARIRVIHKKNGGVSSARNLGLDIANGNYILFMDSDDYLDETAVEDLVNMIKKDYLPRLNIARHFKEDWIDYSVFSKISSNKFIIDVIDSKADGYCWGYLFDKELIEVKFDENTSFMEDTVFLFNYLNKIKYLVATPNSFYNYIDNKNGISSPKNNIEKKINDALYSLDNLEEIVRKKKISNIEFKINDKKILIIEYLLQNVDRRGLQKIITNKQISDILNKFFIKSNLGIRFKIFCFLANKKYILILRNYYIVRRILRIIKRGGR